MKVKVTYPDFTEKYESFDAILARSQYTVLYFYPKDNTPGCILEARGFNSLLDEFGRFATQIVGVSKDDHVSHCNFSQKHGLGFPLISDTDLLLHNDPRFRSWSEKSMFGKKYMGTVRSTFLLDSKGIVVHSWPRAGILGHPAKVLDYIKTGL